MKKLLSITLFLLTISSLFALPPFPVEGEKVELKGTIANFEDFPVALETGGQTYYLMVPRFVSAMVPDGSAVSVEGIKLDETNGENCPIDLDSDKEYLMVTRITYNGVTIDLEKLASEKGDRRGRGNGRRGNGRGGRGGRGCCR